MTPVLYLASRSPRRRVLLEQLGIAYTALDVEVDEDWDGREPAREYASRLALEKALHGWDQVPPDRRLPVLGADTAVVIDDEILGKPAADRTEALAMLERLSGRCHHVYSAVALVWGGEAAAQRVALNVSRVSFRPLSAAEREAYWESGEPLGKAGGYAIQGLAAAFIERLEGSYSGVMGLPLYETAQLLGGIGISIQDSGVSSQGGG